MKLRDYKGPMRANDWEKEKRSQGTLKVPPKWKDGTNTRYVYPRQCFWRSFLYAIHPARIGELGVWLVHGESGLAWGPHAWVELPDGLVFDAVCQRWYKNYYVTREEGGQGGRAWYKYTPIAARRICFAINDEHGKPESDYGMYNNLCLPWGDPNNPLIIDLPKAEELLEERPKNGQS